MKETPLEERQRPARSGDVEGVEMARRVDLVGATWRSADVQGGAGGSVGLRGAASRSAALLMSAVYCAANCAVT